MSSVTATEPDQPRTTNLPWAVYLCDIIRPGEMPQNEVLVSGHLSPGEAMDEANRLRRSDPAHSYVVG